MARYAQNYAGERRSRSVGFKLTPTERARLEAAADTLGVPLSAYVRSLCIKSSPAVAAAVRQNPQARALMCELGAIGNNINQLAKWADAQKASPSQAVLEAAMDMLKNTMSHVMEL